MKNVLFFTLLFVLSLEAIGQCGGLAAGNNNDNGASFYIMTGDCEITGNVTISSNVSLTIPDGTSLTINGDFTTTGNGDLSVTGDFSVTGAVSLEGNALFDTGGNVTIGGNFTVTGNNADVTVGGGFSVGGTADLGGETLTIEDGAVFQAETVTDAAVVVDAGGTIAADGLDTITPAPVIDPGNGDIDCTNGCCGELCNNTGDELSGDGNEVLPITLISFKGISDANNILLKWETASELNFEKFELYKLSNGTKTLIGMVASTGNTQGDQYEFTDMDPNLGNNIYQIQSVDFDGYTEWFSAISILYQPIGLDFNVYPTPATNGHLKSSIDETFLLTIYHMNGQSIFSNMVDGRDLSVLPDLESGIYIFQMNINNYLVKQRVIIQ